MIRKGRRLSLRQLSTTGMWIYIFREWVNTVIFSIRQRITRALLLNSIIFWYIRKSIKCKVHDRSVVIHSSCQTFENVSLKRRLLFYVQTGNHLKNVNRGEREKRWRINNNDYEWVWIWAERKIQTINN